MSVFNQILVALGVFFAAYAALTLLHGRGTSPHRRARPLGCGFTVLAAFVWSVALSRYLQNASAGVRLGTACALILPALATLTRPGRSSILGAATLLTVAVLLGAPVLPALRARLRPSQSAVTVRELDRAVVELNRGIEATRGELEAILDSTATPPPSAAPGTVEEHVARAQLQSLFEREFGTVDR